jgi:catechol 2,3-dioxygenase-like lactoylglutathione lyase family enzyme
MITKIHSATVTVSNKDAAIEFYLNVLGWEKRIDQAVDEHYRFVTVAPVGGDAELALEEPMFGSTPGGQTGISLSVDNIDETFKDLAAKGVKFVDMEGKPVDGPQTMPWGDRACWMQDPDGNTFFFIGQ